MTFSGQLVDRFVTMRSLTTRSVSLGSLRGAPVAIGLAVESADPKAGLELDWVRVATGAGGTLRLTGGARWRAAALVGLLFAILRVAGWDRRSSALLSAPWSIAGAVGLLLDPWLVHRLLTDVPEWLAVLGLGGVLAGRWLVSRGRLDAASLRAVTALMVCAFLLRALALNHPDFYYPDLRSHARMVAVLRRAGWDFLRSPSRYVLEHGVWYRVVAGKSYAFPYTPAFHLPFAAVRLSYDHLLTALKLGAAAASVVPIAALWFLSKRLGASRLGPALMIFIPIYGMHLALAYLAAVFGHAVDMSFLAWLPPRLDNLGRPRTWTAIAILAAACELSYVSSVVILPVFLGVLAAGLALSGAERRLRSAVTLLAAGAAGSLLAVVVYYRDFLGLAADTLSAVVRGQSFHAASDTPDAPVRGFFDLLVAYDVRSFGAAFCLLAIAGLVLLLRERSARLFAGAWAATYLALLLGRARFPFVFQHAHDALFVAPLVCLAAGTAIERLGAPGGWRRALALALVALLALQGTAIQWRELALQFGNAL